LSSEFGETTIQVDDPYERLLEKVANKLFKDADHIVHGGQFTSRLEYAQFGDLYPRVL